MRRTGVTVALFLAGAAGVVLPNAKPAMAAFPGTNGLLTFTRGSSGLHLHLWVMNPDGSGSTDLEPTSNTFALTPSWSSDSKEIAFTEIGPGAGGSTAIGISSLNADGTNHTTVISNAVGPSWAPASKGSKITYYVPLTNGTVRWSNIFVVNTDGTNKTQLTTNTASTQTNDVEPAWSPDGSKIAFYSDRTTPGAGLYVMNADGSGATQIFPFTADISVGDAVEPQWSPDGTKIAFNSGNGGIDVINADKSGHAQLTKDGDHPAWSPDGKLIAFARGNGRGTDIWSMNADGTNGANITKFSDDTLVADPSWGSAPLRPTGSTGGSPPSGGGVTTPPVPTANAATPIRRQPRFTG